MHLCHLYCISGQYWLVIGKVQPQQCSSLLERSLKTSLGIAVLFAYNGIKMPRLPLERTMKQIAWSYCSNVQTVLHVPTMSIHKDHIPLVPLSKDPSRYNQVTRCKQLSTSIMEKS